MQLGCKRKIYKEIIKREYMFLIHVLFLTDSGQTYKNLCEQKMDTAKPEEGQLDSPQTLSLQ